MKKISFFGFLFLIIFAGCDLNGNNSGDGSYNGYVSLNDTVLIGYGDCLYNPENEFYISFDSVLTDSRCPEDVVCFWEGEAVARFNFKAKDCTTNFYDLYVWTIDTVIGKYDFSFIDLYPHRMSGAEILPEDYTARIIIKKQQ